MLLPEKNVRCGRSARVALARVATSLMRRHVRALAAPVIPIEGCGAVVRADLRTPSGLFAYRYGLCDPVSRLARALLHPGDVFVDGGANVGYVALAVATSVGPSGRVIACEPSRRTMTLFRANAELNAFGWVDLREVALADAQGTRTFRSFEPGSGWSSFAPPDPQSACEEHVRVTTLDLLTEGLTGRVRVVKLDLEGAEVAALRGASALLSAGRPCFIVEVEPDHLERQGTSAEELGGIFEAAEYRGYQVRASNGGPSNNVLFIPRERCESALSGTGADLMRHPIVTGQALAEQ